MDTKIKSFTDLNAWKEGHKLVLQVYKITSDFPQGEKFGLIDQMRRCAVSITSNISEGFSRKTKKEKNHCSLPTMAITQLRLTGYRVEGY